MLYLLIRAAHKLINVAKICWQANTRRYQQCQCCHLLDTVV